HDSIDLRLIAASQRVIGVFRFHTVDNIHFAVDDLGSDRVRRSQEADRQIGVKAAGFCGREKRGAQNTRKTQLYIGDRKSTRLNSSHVKISYAVFCLKKKN